MNILGTQIKEGQGLGNRLFVYISTRCIAKKIGYDFSILNHEILEKGLLDKDGIPFIDLEYGVEVPTEIWTKTYNEKNDRLYIGNSPHDIEHGADVSGTDLEVYKLSSGTLIEGILQSPDYFDEFKEEIREWLKVKPQYDSTEFTKDNLCVINIRGGEYSNSPELCLRRKYWTDAMKNMRKLREDMEFVVITDSVEDARRLLPEVPAYHFEVWKDYVSLKNAKYLIISNSSFAFFPAYTSQTVEKIIAPKYWARHNVSDGYWSCEQNIYDEFLYQDKSGKLFTASQCREELERFKKTSTKYKRINEPLKGVALLFAKIRAKNINFAFWSGRAFRSLKRRICRKNG